MQGTVPGNIKAVPVTAGGDPAVDFSTLYRLHASRVRSLVYRMCGEQDLDDLVQEVFIRIWRSLKGFRSEARQETWIWKIALNVCRDELRRRHPWWRLYREQDDRPERMPAPAEEEPDPKAAALRRAMNRLDYRSRAVLALHYFEEHDLQETARILEVPVGTVKSRLHHGRRKLKALLRREGVEVNP